MLYYVYGGDKHPASVLMGWCGNIVGGAFTAGVFPMIYIATRLWQIKKPFMYFLSLWRLEISLKVVCTAGHIPGFCTYPDSVFIARLSVLFSLIYSMIADVCR